MAYEGRKGAKGFPQGRGMGRAPAGLTLVLWSSLGEVPGAQTTKQKKKEVILTAGKTKVCPKHEGPPSPVLRVGSQRLPSSCLSGAMPPPSPRTGEEGWPAESAQGAPVVGSEAGCQRNAALSPPWAHRRVQGAGTPGVGRQGEGPGLVTLLVNTDAAEARDPAEHTADTERRPCPRGSLTNGGETGKFLPHPRCDAVVTAGTHPAPAPSQGQQNKGARCHPQWDTQTQRRLSPGHSTWPPSRWKLCSDWLASSSHRGCPQRVSGNQGAPAACVRGDSKECT